MRALGRAERELASYNEAGDADGIVAAAANVRRLQLDLLYTRWYPRHKKYVSLFPSTRKTSRSGGENEEDDASVDGSVDERTGDGGALEPVAAVETPGIEAEVAAKTNARLERMRRWALANAAAATFLRVEPTAPLSDVELDAIIARRIAGARRASVGGDVMADMDSDVHDSSSSGDSSGDDSSASTISTQESRGRDDDVDVSSDGDAGENPTDSTAHARHFKLQHRGRTAKSELGRTTLSITASVAAAAPAHSERGAGQERAGRQRAAPGLTGSSASALLAVPMRAAVSAQAADEDDGDDAEARNDVALDPFFALPATVSTTSELVFREEEEGEGGGRYETQGVDVSGYGERAVGPARRGVVVGASVARTVMGSQTAAARYEREHMGAKRYRDTAGARGGAAAAHDASTSAGRAAVDLSHLEGRKLRRAERAIAYGAGGARAATGVGAALGALPPGASRYREAYFGTAADPGAVLRSRPRVAHTVHRAPHDSDGTRVQQPRAAMSASAPAPQASPDVANLTGRARKRAERAIEHAARKKAALSSVSVEANRTASATSMRVATAPPQVMPRVAGARLPDANAARPPAAAAEAPGTARAALGSLTSRALKRAQRAADHAARKMGA